MTNFTPTFAYKVYNVTSGTQKYAHEMFGLDSFGTAKDSAIEFCNRGLNKEDFVVKFYKSARVGAHGVYDEYANFTTKQVNHFIEVLHDLPFMVF